MEGKKTGGRQKGTPNKVSLAVRQCLAEITEEYFSSEQFRADFAELEPRDRLIVMEKYARYVAPTLQSMQVDTTERKDTTLSDYLRGLMGSEE